MKLVVGSLLAVTALSSFGQNNRFQNLDFEQATLSPTSGPGGYVPVSAALPDWSVYIGSTEQTQVLQNNMAFGAPSVAVFGPNYPSQLPSATGIIDGNYSAVLQAGGLGGSGPFVSASLEQRGTIPAGDSYLVFKAWQNGMTGFSVSLGGNNLALSVLGSGADYTLYGADVSSYSGQEGLLAFTATAQSAPSLLELDDISFSSASTPEPNPAILIPFGGLLFALCRNRILRR